MGDTARHFAATAPRSLMHESEGWSRESITAIVTRLMDRELNVIEFKPTDRFIQDLGCG